MPKSIRTRFGMSLIPAERYERMLVLEQESVGDSNFDHVDLWSSQYTWGGDPPPELGDLVVVPEGQTLYLDVVTPVLKMVLVQGVLFIKNVLNSCTGSYYYFYICNTSHVSLQLQVIKIQCSIRSSIW